MLRNIIIDKFTNEFTIITQGLEFIGSIMNNALIIITR